MQLRVDSCDIHRTDVRLRMPFRYGIATMTEGPVVFVRVRLVIDGRTECGIASDLIPPKWFTKIPGRPIDEEIREMLAVIRHAAEVAAGRDGASAFELWRHVYEAQEQWGRSAGLPPLLWNFGVSLIERAIIEAVGRAVGKSFGEMIRMNTLAMALEEIHPELKGLAPADLLPGAPRSRVLIRHTIGLVDPLTDAEIPPAERLDDGLPQSLADSIQTYGLRHFKVKVNGDLGGDLDRLARIAAVWRQHAPPDFAFSLDGNEQFKSVGPFREFWNAVMERPELRDCFSRLLFVEQPLHRDAALQPEVRNALAAWPERPPMIIDESDGSTADLRTALELGYDGTSHKNCKGIFKGIAHRCLLEFRKRSGPRRPHLMSGEDLCNIGPVALLQDLAVMAALGIESVERNGHHYHAGLSQFPADVQRGILANHPDLYRPSRAGWPTLRIDGGEINLDSINRAPFGVGFVLDVEQFERIA